MAALSGKTPISFLQEVCVKRGITPAYELVANEGPVHEPLFVFRCQAGNASASGRGTSKRKAKHHAAQAALLRMVALATLSEAEQTVVLELRAAAASESGALEVSGGGGGGGHDGGGGLAGLGNALALEEDGGEENGVNPVGSLQELCQHSLWPQPSYEFSCDNGPVHLRMFNCAVRLWRWQEEAVGKSKKLAKRRAAFRMAHKITSEKLTIPPEELEQLDEAHIPIVERGDSARLSELRVEPLSVKASKEINRFYHGLRSRGAGAGAAAKLLPTLSYSLERSCQQDTCAQLEELSTQHKFSVTYVCPPRRQPDALDVEETATQYQVLLQLGTLPVAVVHGTSFKSEEMARRIAAYNALQYLLLMTNATLSAQVSEPPSLEQEACAAVSTSTAAVASADATQPEE